MVWPEGISILMETQVPSSGSSPAKRAEFLPRGSSHPHGEGSAQCSHSKLGCLQFNTHSHSKSVRLKRGGLRSPRS